MIMSYRTRDGRSCSAAEALDNDKMLRDGYAISIPYTMMDSTAVRFHDGHGNYDAVGHRPGHVVSDAGGARAAVEEAYRLRDEADRNAWRTGGSICVPDHEELRDALPARDGLTLDQLEREHQQRTARAYQAYDEELRNAWRNP